MRSNHPGDCFGCAVVRDASLSQQLLMNHASVMVCQDRKSFGKKTRVLEAQICHLYLNSTSCFTGQLAAKQLYILLIHPHSGSAG